MIAVHEQIDVWNGWGHVPSVWNCPSCCF